MEKYPPFQNTRIKHGKRIFWKNWLTICGHSGLVLIIVSASNDIFFAFCTTQRSKVSSLMSLLVASTEGVVLLEKEAQPGGMEGPMNQKAQPRRCYLQQRGPVIPILAGF